MLAEDGEPVALMVEPDHDVAGFHQSLRDGLILLHLVGLVMRRTVDIDRGVRLAVVEVRLRVLPRHLVLSLVRQAKHEGIDQVEPPLLELAVAPLAQGGNAFAPRTGAARWAALGTRERLQMVADEGPVEVLVIGLVAVVEQALVAGFAAGRGAGRGPWVGVPLRA